MNITSAQNYSPSRFGSFVQTFKNQAQKFESRGLLTLEKMNVTLVGNPRDRLIPHPERKLNFAFAIAEAVGMIAGIDELSFYEPYNSSYCKYSTDGVIVDGAYGARIHSETMVDQISGVVRTLVNDPTSRRAVIAIYNAADLFGGGGKNTPCTLSLNFYIRDNLLHCTVTMRSNDIFWGLGYDWFVFTFVQEIVWALLVSEGVDIGLGTMIHTAHSMHIYERHFDVEPKDRYEWFSLEMNELVPDEFVLRNLGILASVVRDAPHSISQAQIATAQLQGKSAPWFRNLVLAIIYYCARKTKNQQHLMNLTYGQITDSALRSNIFNNWV